MSYILFDIGANWGTDSLKRTETTPDIITYAFEPTPELANHLRNESVNYADRYHIYEVAVSDFNGTSQFNIADQADWGCSSLNTFSDDLERTWPGRSDFKFNRSINVQVVTLESWFEEQDLKIEKIDWFHCDTQGSDLRVLQGMGKYINLIQEGEVESAYNTKLYKENHTFEETESFLKLKGFKIVSVDANDCYKNEVNIKFKKI